MCTSAIASHRLTLFEAFDDTQDLQLDDSMSGFEEKEGPMQPPYAFAQGRNSPRLRGGPTFPPPKNLYSGGPNPYQEGNDAGGRPDWMIEADAERRRQGIDPVYGSQSTHNVYPLPHADDGSDEEYEQDGDVEEGTSFVENTPSRTRAIPEQKAPVKRHLEPVTKILKLEGACDQTQKVCEQCGAKHCGRASTLPDSCW